MGNVDATTGPISACLPYNGCSLVLSNQQSTTVFQVKTNLNCPMQNVSLLLRARSGSEVLETRIHPSLEKCAGSWSLNLRLFSATHLCSSGSSSSCSEHTGFLCCFGHTVGNVAPDGHVVMCRETLNLLILVPHPRGGALEGLIL